MHVATFAPTLQKKPKLLFLAASALFVVAVTTCWWASKRQGQDFGYPYIAAIGIATGAPIYSPPWQSVAFPEKCGLPPPQGMFYPPATGFATLPLAALPYPLASGVWFALLVAAVALGVRALLRLARPDVRPEAWLFVSGAVLLSACVRWGMTPLQGAPLVFGLLAAMVVALHTERPYAALAIAAFAMSFKLTIALPFLGLLLLHRRYAALAASVAIGLGFNVLGFLRVGGAAALRDYRAGVENLEAVGLINTPDPWDPQSSPRLDWVYLFHGLLGDVSLARVLAGVVSVVVAAWILLECRRVERPVSVSTTAAFLVALVCLSVQCVYHHHYDISAILAPLLLGAFLPSRERLRLSTTVSWMMAPLVLMIAFLPLARAQRVLVEAFGGQGAGLMNLAFPIATTLALIGSLGAVRQAVRRSPLAQRRLRAVVPSWSTVQDGNQGTTDDPTILPTRERMTSRAAGFGTQSSS
jgi:hypothetical protein